jgi:hypothetical protein
VVTPEGERGVVLARAVIDATGNADVAAAAGEETEYYRADELIGQGVGMAVIRLGAGGHNNGFAFVDDTDASDLSFFGLRTRSMTEAGAVLRAYAEDPRGFYAHYARRVLDEGQAATVAAGP